MLDILNICHRIHYLYTVVTRHGVLVRIGSERSDAMHRVLG